MNLKLNQTIDILHTTIISIQIFFPIACITAIIGMLTIIAYMTAQSKQTNDAQSDNEIDNII